MFQITAVAKIHVHWKDISNKFQMNVNEQTSVHVFKQRRIEVDATSWGCSDISATLYKRHVPTGIVFFFL